jgi:hypothetical protein
MIEAADPKGKVQGLYPFTFPKAPTVNYSGGDALGKYCTIRGEVFKLIRYLDVDHNDVPFEEATLWLVENDYQVLLVASNVEDYDGEVLH